MGSMWMGWLVGVCGGGGGGWGVGGGGGVVGGRLNTHTSVEVVTILKR